MSNYYAWTVAFPKCNLHYGKAEFDAKVIRMLNFSIHFMHVSHPEPFN